MNLGGDNTVFIVEITDKDANVYYKVYTGIANIPAMKATSTPASYGVGITKDGLVSHAFVKANASNITGLNTDAVFFYIPDTTVFTFVAKTSANPMGYYEYTAYLNGDKTTVKTSDKLAAGDTNKIFTANVKTTEGVYTNATVHTAGTGVVTVANGGTLVVSGDATVYSYDSDTQVYLINSEKDLGISELKVDATDTVTVIAGSNNYAKVVFVREVNSSVTTFTGVDVYVNSTKTNGNTPTGATSDTIAAATEGDKIEIKLTGLAAGASYTVSSKTVPASGTITFSDIVITAVDGTQVTAANYVLTITTITPKA